MPMVMAKLGKQCAGVLRSQAQDFYDQGRPAQQVGARVKINSTFRAFGDELLSH